jgi:hypothetical protein
MQMLEQTKAQIVQLLTNSGIDQNQRNQILLGLDPVLGNTLPAEHINTLKARLQVLYENEKHYWELIKSYKEEIKFANTVQEELRRERAQFFAHTLTEVANALKVIEVDKSVSAQWIQELVKSYTQSLDLSNSLVETHTQDLIGKLKQETQQAVGTLNDNPTTKSSAVKTTNE